MVLDIVTNVYLIVKPIVVTKRHQTKKKKQIILSLVTSGDGLKYSLWFALDQVDFEIFCNPVHKPIETKIL